VAEVVDWGPARPERDDHAERAPRPADGRQNGLAAVDQEQLLGGGLPAKRPAIPDHPDLQDSGGGSRNTS